MANTQLEKYRRIAKTLKNPTPVELPSGKFRCQVTVDGHRESVVDDDPRVAHAQALAIKARLLETVKKPKDMTVGEAIDRYIESKDSVLSPSTIASYISKRNHMLTGLESIKLGELTQEKVQREINTLSKTYSPKSVRCAHGLLSAAMKEYAPSMMLRTTMPQKQRYDAAIPSSDDIELIMNASVGTEIELPVMLAIWLGLRMSEILGLTWDCVQNGFLHIKQAKVDQGVKTTKTYSSNRKIPIPAYIQNLFDKYPKESDYIFPVTRRYIYNRFQTICKKAGVSQHYRFHDMRHANASVMLALNVPDKYAMERMGHSTNNMLKTVYQHTMTAKQTEVANIVDHYFSAKLHTKMHTK